MYVDYQDQDEEKMKFLKLELKHDRYCCSFFRQ